MNVPRREAVISLILLGLLLAALLLTPASPGPGPLALFTVAAAIHAALLAPAIAYGERVWAFLPALVALPALCAVSYGHDGLAGALLIVLLACAAGWAGRAGWRLYLPTMLLIFFAPYALHYLAKEFGAAARADAWLSISPVAAAHRGGWPPAACIAAMAVWPVWSLARSAK